MFHPSLRKPGGILIDCERINHLQFDADSKTCNVGPGLAGDALQRALAAHDPPFFFPTGHANGVGLGGYLLTGGFGWNSGFLGAACYSVISAEFVGADGEIHRTDLEHEQKDKDDLMWALRGSGLGFPGIVTSFKLQLHEFPSIVKKRTLIYPFSADFAEISDALCDFKAWKGCSSSAESLFQVFYNGNDPLLLATVMYFGNSEEECSNLLNRYAELAPKTFFNDSGIVSTRLEDDTKVGTDFLMQGNRQYCQLQSLSEDVSPKEHLLKIQEFLKSNTSPVPAATYVAVEHPFGFPLNRNPRGVEGIFPHSTACILGVWCVVKDEEKDYEKAKLWVGNLSSSTRRAFIQTTESNMHKFSLYDCYPEKSCARLLKLIEKYDSNRVFVGFPNLTR